MLGRSVISFVSGFKYYKGHYIIIIPGLVYVMLILYKKTEQFVHTTNISGAEENILTLANIKNFYFNLNDKTCDHDVFSILVVPSHPDHTETRKILRYAYNRHIFGKKCQVVFLLGLLTDAQKQHGIIEENDIYHDIIQGSFIDSYKNVTYNHLQGLLWGTAHCSQAMYIIKADDDIYLNLPTLTNILKTKDIFKMKIFCSVFRDGPPIRDPESKYYVSEEDFPESSYPDYCSGMLVVYPTDVARLILDEATKTKFMWMSDVYITGILVKKLMLRTTISLVDMMSLLTFSDTPLYEWLKTGTNLSALYGGPIGNDIAFLRDLHRKTYKFSDEMELNMISKM